MPTTYKVLAQVNPSATTSTVAYTCPSATQTIISSISVANLASTDATYRISLRPNGETLANKHYFAYDITVGASDTTVITVGMTLDASDIIDVYASTANLAFHFYGSEIS